MSTIIISSNTLRETKRLFSRLKHLRCKLPVLKHLLLTAGANGIHLAATDLDHWLESQITDQPTDSASFLIPPAGMDAACRADKGTDVTFVSYGGKRSRELGLIIQCGGITATSIYPTLDPSELPSRPNTIGTATELPPATLQRLASVAGCASTDITRQILNGVLFTPEDGGNLVATDGRRLACCPATVPQQAFVLPNNACAILGHPDFQSDIAVVTWIDHEDEDQRQVAIRSGRHLLMSKPLVGNYPNYKQVIPHNAPELVIIPHDRKPGLIAWLRNISKDQSSVRLDWQKRGHLTLSHRDVEGRSDVLHVPVEIHGTPPVIAFNARYLADALEIGSTLHLTDELSPGICRHPTGRFCVIMPMRVTIAASVTREIEAAPTTQAQAA